ncbi:MAG: hypothetical protein ACXVP0_11030, partial [Bacteroidia bacterium]
MKRILQYFTKERLFLLFIVIVFYGNTLKNDYAIDDSFVTQKTNITAKGISSIPKIFHSYYVDNSDDHKFDYRPLVKVSFAIEHELFDVSPKVSHFFNLLFYLMALYVALTVLRLLFPDIDSRIPFYCVVLFAVFPIHTEVVGSIKNRDILLCFLFSMLSLKNYVLFYDNKKRIGRLAAGFILLYFAFLSKFDALPFLVMIPAFIFLRHSVSFKWLFIFAVLLVGSHFLFRLTQRSFIGAIAGKRENFYFENPLYFGSTVATRCMALFNSLGFYINQVIFPYKQCCYYGERTIPVNALTLHGYIGIVSVPALAYGMVRSLIKKDTMLFTGLFMFCASIAMYTNFLVPVLGIVADRFTFLASLGASVAIVAL